MLRFYSAVANKIAKSAAPFVNLHRKITVSNLSASSASRPTAREDFSEYVAHLQLHMALQARNLVPSMSHDQSSQRQAMLHQTQADIEKMVSRQAF